MYYIYYEIQEKYMYLDKTIYSKPKDCTLVTDMTEPSVSLKKQNVRSRVNLDLVPGKNINPMIVLKSSTGT